MDYYVGDTDYSGFGMASGNAEIIIGRASRMALRNCRIYKKGYLPPASLLYVDGVIPYLFLKILPK